MKELQRDNSIFAESADKALLRDLALNGQHPVAAVVACSDSRVPVEIIFNQLEPGRLFVIRVAGNIVAEPSVTGSIEFAVLTLKTSTIVCLGHTGCGAVAARLNGITEGETGKLLNHINVTKTTIDEAVEENVREQMKNIAKIPALSPLAERGEIEIVGMVYDLMTGTVRTLES